MKILLLGCNGQVGWELQRSLAPLGELVAVDFDTPGEIGGVPRRADFSRPDSLVELIKAVNPDAIVNAAAYTAVDKAESEPEAARTINATAPAVLAREAKTRDALLVQYSTDYVFDGSGRLPRDEEAPTGPLSVYGRTKLEGEEAIRSSNCRHLILRTSWVYAARGVNFAKTILRLATEREELSVIDDQVGAPTGADLLADVTAHVVRAVVAAPSLVGTYHCTAASETSWHGYARFVIEHARALGHPVKTKAGQVRPVPTTAYPTAARRPLNSRLDTGKLRRTFGLHLPQWQGGVERMLDETLQTR